MRGNRRWPGLRLDTLEDRALLSVTTGGHNPPAPPSPAVLADIAKIDQDEQTLLTDIIRLAPTLQQDQQAINTAINSSTSVKAAQAQFQADEMTWGGVIRADAFAVVKATTPAAEKAAITKLESDQGQAAQVFQTDAQAVQTAINTDPNVQAAQAKLKADSALIAADQATLAADFAQLQSDLQGGSSTGTGSGGSAPPA